MDWRNRNYYLVKLYPWRREMRLEYFRIAAPTMKIHRPYNHHKDANKISTFCHDGIYFGGFWHMMVTCKKEDSEALEYELRKAVRRDDGYSNFKEITKEMCGQ